MRNFVCFAMIFVLFVFMCGCSKSEYGSDYSSVVETVIYEETISQIESDSTVNSNQPVSDIGSTSAVENIQSNITSSITSSSDESETSQETVYRFNDATVLEKIKTNGRCEINSNGIGLGFAASAVEFEIEGSSAILQVDCNVGVYYSVEVDGTITQKRAATKEENEYIILTRGLNYGKHTIKFIRETEGRPNTELTAVSLQVDGGKLGDRPSPKKQLIEFLGDSITSGYGNLYDNSGKASDLKNQSSLSAYSYLTAKKLDIDYRIVSKSGIALKERSGYPTFLNYYLAEDWHKNQSTPYTSSSSKDVDIVVVNLGTNDVSQKMLDVDNQNSVEEYSNEFYKLITDIGYSTDTKIVFMSGGGWCKKQSVVFGSVIKKLNSAGYASVYSFEASANTGGGENHPSAAEHDKISDELVAFLKNNNIVN